MFHYGIRVLEVQQGMKSYHTVKQFSTQQIGEVKAMIERKEVLGLWLSKTRDLDKLKQWQEQIQKDQEKLVAAGVKHELYVKEDNDEWHLVKNLPRLLQQDYKQLAMLLEREEQATAAWKRYRDRQDQDSALDEIIELMPKDMQAVLYADEDDHRVFAHMIQNLIPSADTSEARMLSYEFHSHVKRQNMMKNVFMRPVPAKPGPVVLDQEAIKIDHDETQAVLSQEETAETNSNAKQAMSTFDTDTKKAEAALPDEITEEMRSMVQEKEETLTNPEKQVKNTAPAVKASLWSMLWSKLSSRR